MKWKDQMPLVLFLTLEFQASFFTLFHFHQDALQFLFALCHKGGCLKLLIFLPAILISACASSSPVFHMMYSLFYLNKQDDNIPHWHTPIPILNQSIVPCPVLIVASWLAYRSEESGKMVWYSHLLKNFPQFAVIHTVKVFSIVDEAEVNVFLEFSCFFYDPTDVDN